MASRSENQGTDSETGKVRIGFTKFARIQSKFCQKSQYYGRGCSVIFRGKTTFCQRKSTVSFWCYKPRFKRNPRFKRKFYGQSHVTKLILSLDLQAQKSLLLIQTISNYPWISRTSRHILYVTSKLPVVIKIENYIFGVVFVVTVITRKLMNLFLRRQ